MSAIIPFPKRNDPSGAQDFPTGRHVLAVYPGTTALYKATVVNGHRKVTSPSTCLLLVSTLIQYFHKFGESDVVLTASYVAHAVEYSQPF